MNPEQLQGLLLDARRGSPAALERLFVELRDDLRAIVRRSRRQRECGSMRTTELFNESYIKVFGGNVPELHGPEHLLAVWSNAARWVVIEARRRRAARPNASPDDCDLRIRAIADTGPLPDECPERVEELFTRLRAALPTEGLAAELKLIGGLRSREIAAGLDVSEPTVRRWVRTAEVWLRAQVAACEPDGSDAGGVR